MNRTLAAAVVWTVTSAVALAQDDGKQDGVRPDGVGVEGDAHKQQIEDHIQEMRVAIRDDVPVITNVRVMVQLRNRHKITGVVKRGRFVERVNGLDFSPADLKSSGAGIRVWYYDNSKSYIFLPFDAISAYRIGARLTDNEVREIEAKMDSQRDAAQRTRQEQLDKRASAEAKAGEQDVAKELAKNQAETAKAKAEQEKEEARLLALLTEFPPDEGWGEAKLAEIEARKVSVGAYPDEHAQRFLAVFPDWQRAMEVKSRRAATPPVELTEKLEQIRTQTPAVETPAPSATPPGGAAKPPFVK